LRFAAPVCAHGGLTRLAALCGGVVHVEAPSEMASVGEWYDDFTQITDDEVIAILGEHR